MVAVFWIVLGVLLGSIVKLLAWEKAPVGWLPVLLVGIAGAALGGYVRTALLPASDMPGFDPAAILFTIGGAVVLLWLFGHAYVRAQVDPLLVPKDRRHRTPAGRRDDDETRRAA